ncbi:MAG: inositol 2-dehydrogenase [Ilumatobacter sp.]|uniref:inositol 2-dehydrogenase n=1 Tax=Ilumatobacter sp. TaxID=1967498 RepID=UPI00262AC606|nr:inositol 2-dehydrogenase [Ilumatobacter sp.]MDJ0770191.1 inositol 2-dehydrogenase [Ilumatobacter sp.]
MTTPLRIGLLGCGRIGVMHADLLSGRIDGLTLGAVYDVVGEAAERTGARYDAAVAASPDELIEHPEVDAVAICSSTDTHIDLLVQAAAAGKPVFIEKPLSLALDQVDRGIAAADAAGIPVQVGFNRRFDPSHRLVRDRVADGDVGDVHLVRITSRDPAPPPVSYIEVSGGIFLDMTIHDFDMARFVTGSEVVDVFAHASVRVDPAIGEAGDYDTLVVAMRHENGAITTIDNSRQAVYGYDQRVEVFGSGGMAASDNPLTTTSVYRNADGGQLSTVPYFFLDRYIPSYLAEWESFLSMVRDGTPTPVSLADGRAPLVLGLAAGLSVRESRLVRVDDIG